MGATLPHRWPLRDSNPDASRPRILNPLRIPIPPRGLRGCCTLGRGGKGFARDHVGGETTGGDMSNGEQKPWMITLLLCVFAGTLGAHRFYVGKIGSGV